MTIRSSQDSPLRIDTIRFDSGAALGMTICPGKQGQSVSSQTYWQRDLATDIAAIRQWGAAVVITLLEPHELVAAKVGDLGEAIRAANMDWRHLPTPDRQPLGATFAQLWPGARVCVHRALDRGHGVLIHCMGGLGRTGTLAAQVLMERSMPCQSAIDTVRAARPGTIETAGQEAYLHALTTTPHLSTAHEPHTPPAV